MTKHLFTLSREQHLAAASEFRIRFGRVESPVGVGYLAVCETRIVGFLLTDNRSQAIDDLSRNWPGSPLVEDQMQLMDLAESAFLPVATKIEILLKGTAFQLAVWQALCDIPSGRLVSYQEVAEAIGRPRSVRATANAIGKNPVCILAPCHRVIRSDGGIGGFSCGLEYKRALLAKEGISLP